MQMCKAKLKFIVTLLTCVFVAACTSNESLYPTPTRACGEHGSLQDLAKKKDHWIEIASFAHYDFAYRTSKDWQRLRTKAQESDQLYSVASGRVHQDSRLLLVRDGCIVERCCLVES